MKPAGKSEARIMLSALIFLLLEDLLQLGEADAIERRNGKGVRRGANAFQIRLGAWHTRPLYMAALGFVRDYLRRRFTHFKLRAHFLDLRGLLFQLGRENLHPFRLLGDSDFQGLHFVVLFEELVEQHHVDLLVAHGRDFTILCCTTRSGFTLATSSAIKPYWVLPFSSLLYLKVTGLSARMASLALSIG